MSDKEKLKKINKSLNELRFKRDILISKLGGIKKGITILVKEKVDILFPNDNKDYRNG